MNIVTPETKTTLLLNKYMEAFGYCTARAAFRHLINGSVSGIDANESISTWDGSDPNYDPKELDDLGRPRPKPSPNPINWGAQNIQTFPDQPVLRSAPREGEDTCWFIPTVVRCNRTFGFRAKNNRELTLHELYKLCRKRCQYCWDIISFSEATVDHIYPRSRGGSNEKSNRTLACRRCNNKKDSQFPYFDKNGKVPKAPRMLPSGMYLPPDELIRPEWRKYLYLE